MTFLLVPDPIAFLTVSKSFVFNTDIWGDLSV
jgi:CRISPR/Cas system CMR subunit Cmr6 (Cas7 group RAMP superfamily)